MFNPLGEEQLKKIITIEISNLISRLNEKDYIIEFDQSVSDKIFELNSEEDYGARPVKRIIQNLCEDFLSDEILRANIKQYDHVHIKCNKDGELTIDSPPIIEKRSKKPPTDVK
jgi:ATP-dependent Clp protease ATP-binding subunit ClpC